MTVDRNPLRVLHVISSTDRRGAETAAVGLMGMLEERGCRGAMVALAPGLSGGLDVLVLGRSRFSRAGLARLRAEARSAGMVIAHGSSTLPAVSLATAGTGIPFVYRSVGDPRVWVNTPSRRGRVRAAVQRASAVVALWTGSAVAWHEYLGVPANRIVVIPNGVDERKFPLPSAAGRAAARLDLGLEPAGSVVLCLGALSPEKRVDLAIGAVSTLDGVSLIVVGDGPERARLQSLAASAGRGKVRLLGATDRPQRAFAAADVVVIPSDTEGQPSVAIEAGLSGLPVVATRVGGLAEVVQDGGSGFLVPPGDHSALAESIRAALSRRSEMGAAGRRHCLAHFDLGQVADAWLQLLDSNLSGSSRPDQFGGSTRKMP